MYLTDKAGNILGTSDSPMIMQLATTLEADNTVFVPPSELIPIVVSSVAYANPIVLPSAGGNVACLRATASGGVTALIQVELNALKSRTTLAKGVTLSNFTVFWSLTTQVLTAGPSATVNTATFPTPAASAAAATMATTAGGTITTVPVATQTAIPTAGQIYGTQFVLGTPLVLNNSLMSAFAEMSFPCTNGSVLYVAGVQVGFSYQP